MSELISLRSLFKDGKEDRFFRIPEYQRGYSWEKLQRSDLLDDIYEICNHSTDHFAGTIVAAKPSENQARYSIVDGQQRLTTLLILIARILLKLKDSNSYPGEGMTHDSEWDTFISRKDDDCTKWRLELNGKHKDIFEKLIIEKSMDFPHLEVQTKSGENLKAAVSEFDNYLKGKSAAKLQKIYYALTNKIGFLFYAPEDSREIGLMFEVINNRGKPLSELEKVKNYIIYYANKHKSEKHISNDLEKSVNINWGIILSRLNKIGFTSNEDEQSFLRTCWLVFKSPQLQNSYHVYENLKSACPPNTNKNKGFEFLKSFVFFLEKASKSFEMLFCPDVSKDGNIKIFLERIAYQPSHSSIMPFIVALLQREDDVAKCAQVLDIVEKLNFRFYISGIAGRSDAKQGRLYRLAHAYYHQDVYHDTSKKIVNTDDLYNNLIDFIEENANVNTFINQLILNPGDSGDFYQWQGLKFFLASYEQNIHEIKKTSIEFKDLLNPRDPKHSNDFFQKEHILSQALYLDKEQEFSFLKRRLGNFVLIREGTNKGAGKMPVIDKIKNGYKSQAIKELYQLDELEGYYINAENYVTKKLGRARQTWGFWKDLLQRMFDLRETELINFALKRWGVEVLPDEQVKVIIDSFKKEEERVQIKKSAKK